MEESGGLQSMSLVGYSPKSQTRLSDFTFTFIDIKTVTAFSLPEKRKRKFFSQSPKSNSDIWFKIE